MKLNFIFNDQAPCLVQQPGILVHSECHASFMKADLKWCFIWIKVYFKLVCSGCVEGLA